MKLRDSHLKRRRFLRATGVCMALPLLESLTSTAMGQKQEQQPERIVAINIPLGFYGPEFFPTQTGRQYELPPTLAAAEAVKENFTIISGASHPEVDGGHQAEASFLTGAPHPARRNFKNTLSFDQLLAKAIGSQTRFPSLTLGERSISWNANGVSIPAEKRPENVYRKLFLKGTPAQTRQVKQRLSNGQSILDVLNRDAQSLQRKVSRVDQSKLDQYFTALREVEQRFEQAELWSNKPLPTVNEQSPKPVETQDVTGLLEAFFKVIHLALMTDSTRVITLCGHGGSLVPPLKGVNKGYHALTHHGKTKDMINQLKQIDRETIRVWGQFIQSLQETHEGSDTLLSRTQVFLGSNLGNANAHTTDNLPILLAGGTFKHGQHLAFDSANNLPVSNLFVTMAQEMGLPIERFASSTGTVSQLRS